MEALIESILNNLWADTDSINWITKFDEAKKIAKEEDKNIFVLITAPSWCEWCVKLEENVLSNNYFKENISSDYVSLKLLDVVNGKRNPELENFYFGGSFKNNNDNTWSVVTNNSEAVFNQVKYDFEYIYIEYEGSHSVIALPLNGNQSYIKQTGNGEWNKFFLVEIK